MSIPIEILSKNTDLLYIRLSEKQKDDLLVLADFKNSTMSQVARAAIDGVIKRNKYNIEEHRIELERRKEELTRLERE